MLTHVLQATLRGRLQARAVNGAQEQGRRNRGAWAAMSNKALGNEGGANGRQGRGVGGGEAGGKLSVSVKQARQH